MLTKIFLITMIGIIVVDVSGQTTEFTYQGSLRDGSNSATGNYDFEFALFDDVSAGGQIGSTIPKNNVAVTNGIFSVKLDFGAQFPGANRYLEIRVRLAGQPGITILGPRQLVNSSPYSVKSLNTDNADQLGGVAANQYVVTTDPRMTDARPPTAGSTDYIQNQNLAPQATSNFNISGNGTVSGTLGGNIVNAATRFEIGGLPILSNGGTDNLFSGIAAGQSNTSGFGNAFFGRRAGFANNTGLGNAFFGSFAGEANTTGSNNAFFGRSAGDANTTGGNNAFFGKDAGGANTTGTQNAFFGAFAGLNSTTGVNNAFFGNQAGALNQTGISNAFFGAFAGLNNMTGDANAFFGRNAGQVNETGDFNAFFGASAGDTNQFGSNNTIIGDAADVASSGLNFATAIGAGAIVAASSRVQLGRGGLDTVSVGLLGAATATNLCINGTLLSSCSSSARYKENIRPFAVGLDLVRRLRPVTFDWIERSEPDLGLIAEEVATVEPLLVTRNQKGEIEGVKYDQIAVTLVNAVKEQQTQIESQQRQIDELKMLLCIANKTAEICKETK